MKRPSHKRDIIGSHHQNVQREVNVWSGCRQDSTSVHSSFGSTSSVSAEFLDSLSSHGRKVAAGAPA